MNWVTQGLTNILPQPDEKYREATLNPNDEQTEVRGQGNRSTDQQVNRSTGQQVNRSTGQLLNCIG